MGSKAYNWSTKKVLRNFNLNTATPQLRIIGRYGEPHAFVGEPLSPLTDASRENRHPALEEKREHKVKTKVVRRRLGQPLIKSGDVKAGV